MRSEVACVLLLLLIRRGGSEPTPEDDFRPTPIPLNEWREVRGGRSGHAGAPPTASVPAHYWEDALRHSVYLTLVRDKIDQLITKGDVAESKEVDDHDLWDKIKRAPFERTDNEEPTAFGDVTMMAKGKLMDDHKGFRFTEDDKFKDKCTHEKCLDGVKAFWSVKRVRQRDFDKAPGQYHYELTFSVITQRKHKKPYEKPARTFTVRESVPEQINEAPKESRYYEPQPIQAYTPRPERSLWFHKNIVPARNQGRQHHNGLDRLFSSLFDDDEVIHQPRPRPSKQYIPQSYQQYSKVGYVGSPSEQQQKKLNPYGYNKPHLYKYTRPIPPPPPQAHHQHHYLDIDAIGVVSAPYTQDQRHGPPSKYKTPRPPVLPTPPNPVLPVKNFTFETTTKFKVNVPEETTQQPESGNTHKPHSKPKPPVKITYITDHVRPPVFNAPPGVFVTMDKKPFKPMPPLRLVHSSKHHKTPRPVDFRPSPQVLDIQFSEPDPLADTAFRPITINYLNSNTTEKVVLAVSDTNVRKTNTTAKKPPKKHENIKAQRVTTSAPDIITAHNVESDSDGEWANILGAFAKTTPMAAEKEKVKTPETTTPMTTSTSTTTTSTTSPITTQKWKKVSTTTEATSTTPKPKKRTRPPHKFNKPEKLKSKRVSTTTTTEPPVKRGQDLTPQASSAAATAKLTSSTSTTTTTVKPTTTTTQTTTTKAPVTTTTTTTTTTTQATTTTTEPQSTPRPESDHIKRKNRYRQSTLKYRSTSGKIDKKEEKARTILPPTGKFPPRRKGSKFQNDIPSTTPTNTDKQYDSQGREDHVVSPYKSKSASTTESTTNEYTSTTSTTATSERIADLVSITSESPEYSFSQDESYENSEDEQESRDHSEFVPSTFAFMTQSEKTNEIVETEDETIDATEEAVTTPKNKPKCKKKKLQNSTTSGETTSEASEAAISEAEPSPSTAPVTTTTTTTETPVTPDIFQEIFGGFTFDDALSESNNKESTTAKLEPEGQETSNREQFIKAEEDFEDFFEAFENENKDSHLDDKLEDQYEYDDNEPVLDDVDSLLQNEEDRRTSRDSHDEDSSDDYDDRPFSLLELMAME